MQDQNDQPDDECEYTAWNGNKHQPTQYPKSIKELTIIMSIDDARMHRPFIHFAAMRVGD